MATNNTIRRNSSLEIARYYIERENYGRAFAHLLLYFKLVPDSHINLEKEFVEVTKQWCSELLDQNKVQHSRYCYRQAARYFPMNIDLMNDFAAHFLRCNEIGSAIKYFEIAHTMYPEDLATEKNLQSVYANKVPQWHFRMLNDKHRNAFYKNAIEQTISAAYKSCNSAMQILDIGTGSGLLTLFASKFIHSAKTIANNNVKLFAIEECEIMEQIASRIFAQNNVSVELVHGVSTEIANDNNYHLLITEIFDCCLFGEGVLSTLIHAHENLLSRQNPHILPHSARLLVFGIESESIDQKFHCSHPENATERGLKLTLPKCIKRINFDDPYDAFNLATHNFNQLTDVNKDIFVNFTDYKQLQNIVSHEDAFDDIVLNVEQSGRCHALVICFELTLDALRQYTITTNPLEKSNDNYCCCWEQGVVHFNHPTDLRQGDQVKLQISAKNDKLEVKLKHPEQIASHECFEIDQEALAFINFHELTAVYTDYIENLSDNWPENVLDLTVIPIFSILLLKHAKSRNKRVNVTVNISKTNAKLISHLFDINEIDDQPLTILVDNDLNELIQIENQFDLIVFDPMLPNGVLNEQFYSNIAGFKHLLKHDENPMKCGKFLPDKVQLCFEIVQSTYLERCSLVMDENLFGFAIAKKFNEFSVNEMRSIASNAISAEVGCLRLSPVTKTSIFETEKLRETRLQAKIIQRGFPSGFIYWFECFYGFKSISSYNSAYDQSAFLLSYKDHQERQLLCLDDIVNVNIKQDKGLLKISFVK